MRRTVAFTLVILLVPVASAERLDRCEGVVGRVCEDPVPSSIDVPPTPQPGITRIPPVPPLPPLPSPGLDPLPLPPLPDGSDLPIGPESACMVAPESLPNGARLARGAMEDLGLDEGTDDVIAFLDAAAEPRERCETLH